MAQQLLHIRYFDDPSLALADSLGIIQRLLANYPADSVGRLVGNLARYHHWFSPWTLALKPKYYVICYIKHSELNSLQYLLEVLSIPYNQK